MKKPVRKEALRILLEVDKGKFAQSLIDGSLSRDDWPERDRRLLNEIVLGIIRQKGLIDWILGRFVKQGLKKIEPELLNILRIGVYQRKFLARIPDYAIVSECVNLAKVSGKRKAADFINAVLREFLRKEDEIIFPDKSDNLSLYLSVKFSHPRWLIERWLGQFGGEKTKQLCEADNRVPPLIIRANTFKMDREALKKKLEEEGFRVEITSFAPEGLKILNGSNILRHQFFYSGFFQVQDESAMLVSYLLAPRDGELIVDVCSSPGGKATHLASLMNDRGEILALDVSREKLKKVEDNFKRLGITCIKTLLLRGENIQSLRIKPDAILLDAPCSNLGVLRRRVEVRWRITPQQIKNFQKQQLKLLGESAEVLKKGGRLVYSTCTVTAEENEKVISGFLKNDKRFSVDKTCPSFLKRFQSSDGSIRLYPESDDMDKIFMVKLVKNLK